MDAALEALASLGTPFPTAELDLEEAIAAEQPRVESRLAATDVASLPETSDPKSLALLRLMDRVIVGGYSTGQVGRLVLFEIVSRLPLAKDRRLPMGTFVLGACEMPYLFVALLVPWLISNVYLHLEIHDRWCLLSLKVNGKQAYES